MSRFAQLCPIFFGAGEINNTGAVAKELGMTRVLLVTEKNIMKAGIPNKAIKSLENAGIQVFVYDGVMMDAPDVTVVEGAEFAAKEQVDGIIGCGGGSSLDTAKAIALFVNNMADIDIKTMIVFNPEKPVALKSNLKNIMIPTTSGTGSEVTCVAVITDTSTHSKCGCLVSANAAIVDPELTIGLDQSITAYTAMDAFSHDIESLCNLVTNPHSEVLALDSIRRIVQWLPVAVKDTANAEARYNLAIASNWAGMAFQDASVNVGHAMAHALGARLQIPHGIGCALVTPSVIELVAGARPDVYMRIAEIFGLEIASAEELPLKLSDAVRVFSRKVGIPSLRTLGFTREQILSTVDYALGEGMRMGCIVPQDERIITDMMAKVYDLYE